MRLKNERPRLSKTVDDVVATIRMTLRNHANKFDEFWRIWRSIIFEIVQRSISQIVQRSISPAKRTMVYITCMTSYTYNGKKVS